MKKSKIVCWICVLLVCTLCLSACGSKQELDSSSNPVNAVDDEGNGSKEFSDKNKDEKTQDAVKDTVDKVDNDTSAIESNNDTDNINGEGNADVTTEAVPGMMEVQQIRL